MGHSEEIARRKYRQIRAKQSKAAAEKVALGARPTPPTPEPGEGTEVIPLRRGKTG